MPMFIPAALALGATFATGVVATALSVAAVISSVVVGMMAQRKAEKQARDQFNAAQVDRMANVVATVGPREIVLGRVRKGGTVAFRGSAGELNEKFMVHLALAAHEIDAVEAIYLNDLEVTLDVDGYVQDRPYLQRERFSHEVTSASPLAGTVVVLPHTPVSGTVKASAGVTTGSSDTFVAITVVGASVTIDEPITGTVTISYQYETEVPYARIRWDLGAGTAVADARTLELFPDLWTAAHRGQGIAKLIAEFTYNETSLPSGMPAITARIRGAKVYDPRSATTVWSENPALLARHVYQHPYFGKATVSAAEDVRFSAAANACDVSHDYVVGPGSDVRPLFTAGMVGQFGAPASSLLDDLSQAMAGMWAFAGGEIYIRAGVYTAPVLTLTDADLAVVQRSGESESQEQMTISVHRERAEKFNVVNLRIWDGGQDFKQAGLTPVKGAALIARDGAELAQEISLAAVSHAAQAQHVAGVMMRDARDPLMVEAPFKMTAYPLEMFDTVRLTLARYGWTDKTFVVLGRVWNHDRGVIKLTLKEITASIFTPDASFLPQGYADNTALPQPWDIDPPALTAEGVYSGTDELLVTEDGTIITRVRVTWPALTIATITSSGSIEVQWRQIGTDVWRTVTVEGGATEALISGVRERRAIVIRARSRNSLATSDWSLQVVHIVVGKTEPPPPVDRFWLIEEPGGNKHFFWRLDEPPADLGSFQVRYSLGTVQRPWDEMIRLFTQGRDAREHDARNPPLGDTYTFAIRTLDTTGHASEPVYITETIDGDTLGTVDLLVLPYELGWPGEKTNCYVTEESILVDIGVATWNDLDVSWSALDQWLDMVGMGSLDNISYEHEVIDTGSSVARIIRVSQGASGDVTTKYCSSVDGVTYTDWGDVPATAVTARYFKVRWNITGTTPILYRAQIAFY